jgi:hypothetical protein
LKTSKHRSLFFTAIAVQGFVQGEMLFHPALKNPVEYVVHPGATHEIPEVE